MRPTDSPSPQDATAAGAAAATEAANALILLECVWGGVGRASGGGGACGRRRPPVSLLSGLPTTPFGPLTDLDWLRPALALSLRRQAAAAMAAVRAQAAASAAAAAALADAAAALEAAPPAPSPTPVFACLGVAALASCLREAADEVAGDEALRARATETLASLAPRDGPAPAPAEIPLTGDHLRGALTVCVAAWKATRAPRGGRAAAGLAAVRAEMEGF